mgnify:CR=1 FL=1
MKNLQTMKHSVQKGFTLIELMIVVAIIGILAAVAIPAYSDYTIKAKVAEATSMSGPAKMAVDISYSENGALPTGTASGNSTLGISNAGSYKAKYVSSVTIGDAGVITVDLKDIDELGTAGGTSYDMTPTANGGTLQWAITGTSGSPLPVKYLPKS